MPGAVAKLALIREKKEKNGNLRLKVESFGEVRRYHSAEQSYIVWIQGRENFPGISVS